MHRWDIQAARGRPEPLEAGVAADAVDEMLHLMLPAHHADLPWAGPPCTLGLATVDTGHGWTLRLRDGGPAVEQAAAGPEADARLAGTASDLLLLLYRRIDPATVTVEGDLDVVRGLTEWLVIE